MVFNLIIELDCISVNFPVVVQHDTLNRARTYSVPSTLPSSGGNLDRIDCHLKYPLYNSILRRAGTAKTITSILKEQRASFFSISCPQALPAHIRHNSLQATMSACRQPRTSGLFELISAKLKTCSFVTAFSVTYQYPEIPIGTKHERTKNCNKRISKKILQARIRQVPQIQYIPERINCDRSALQQRLS